MSSASHANRGGENALPAGPRNHALVVGGTGMLSAVTLTLARLYTRVTVVSRGARRYVDRVETPLRQRLVPCPVDYHDTAVLIRSLETRQEDDGPFELAVCWIHSSARGAPEAVARCVGSVGRPCRFAHVRSSTGRNVPGRRAGAMALIQNIVYQEIVLGASVRGYRMRWLSDEEISRGVLEAIRSGRPRFVVGSLGIFREA